jgi:hypothetical protein
MDGVNRAAKTKSRRGGMVSAGQATANKIDAISKQLCVQLVLLTKFLIL